jgi:hypothetical protein
LPRSTISLRRSHYRHAAYICRYHGGMSFGVISSDIDRHLHPPCVCKESLEKAASKATSSLYLLRDFIPANVETNQSFANVINISEEERKSARWRPDADRDFWVTWFLPTITIHLHTHALRIDCQQTTWHPPPDPDLPSTPCRGELAGTCSESQKTEIESSLHSGVADCTHHPLCRLITITRRPRLLHAMPSAKDLQPGAQGRLRLAAVLFVAGLPIYILLSHIVTEDRRMRLIVQEARASHAAQDALAVSQAAKAALAEQTAHAAHVSRDEQQQPRLGAPVPVLAPAPAPKKRLPFACSAPGHLQLSSGCRLAGAKGSWRGGVTTQGKIVNGRSQSGEDKYLLENFFFNQTNGGMSPCRAVLVVLDVSSCGTELVVNTSDVFCLLCTSICGRVPRCFCP